MENFRVFHFLFLLCPALLLSCNDRFDTEDIEPGQNTGTVLTHDEIVLGDRLEDPYAVENMQRAYESLYPTKAREEIQPTDYYVRFLPEDDKQLEELLSYGLQLIDYPFDYQIIKDGDYYHDPEIAKDKITWQYAVVPADFEFPAGIRSEIIHPCFLSENSPAAKSSGGVDWDAVEREAFIITGNGALLEDRVKGGGEVQPQGRITITDPAADGGQPVGVAGVTVSCNIFAKFSSSFTDRDGYYKMPRTFSGTPRYRLVFKNSKGFSIGFNSILYPASISTLGTNPASGVSVDVDQDSERKLFRRCVVNNAAYDFIRRCDISDLNLPVPTNLCFWLFDEIDKSSAIMLHHGTALDTESSNTIFKIVSWVVNFFAPDITLGTRDCKTFAEFYSYVCHEMAHACHFNSVGTSYWNEYIRYIALCALRGQTTYGDGTLEGSGVCAVGEMWAYYLQNKMYKERYGGNNPSFGSGYWFHPQILTSLEDRGIQTAGIFAALNVDVKSKDSLRSRLGELYPSKKTSIDQIFNRYD